MGYTTIIVLVYQIHAIQHGYMIKFKDILYRKLVT